MNVEFARCVYMRLDRIKDEMTDKQSSHQFSTPNTPSILPSPFEWIHILGGKVRLRYPPYKPVPALDVEVTSFYISKHLITNAQYSVYVNETGREIEYTSLRKDDRFTQPLHPVVD